MSAPGTGRVTPEQQTSDMPRQRGRRRRVDRVRCARLHHDLAHALPGERVARVGRRAAERPGPGVTAVRRLVDADARDAAGAADVRLAGPHVDRVAGRVVRVDGHRAGRVDPERSAEVLPVRLTDQRVLRAPHTAARGRDVELAVTRHARVADRDRRRPASRDVLGRDVAERAAEHRLLRVERLARADRDPGPLRALPARERPALRRGERRTGAGRRRKRDRVRGIRSAGGTAASAPLAGPSSAMPWLPGTAWLSLSRWPASAIGSSPPATGPSVRQASRRR